jgi:hypothetical protein
MYVGRYTPSYLCRNVIVFSDSDLNASALNDIFYRCICRYTPNGLNTRSAAVDVNFIFIAVVDGNFIFFAVVVFLFLVVVVVAAAVELICSCCEDNFLLLLLLFSCLCCCCCCC